MTASPLWVQGVNIKAYHRINILRKNLNVDFYLILIEILMTYSDIQYSPRKSIL